MTRAKPRTFTGWGSDGNPVIGAVPSSDVAAIAAIDVDADKETAVNNNYSLISMRGAKGGGMDQIEQIISKNTTQTKNKVRNVAYSEDLVRSNIQTLYDTILEKKVEYDSATTAWQAAQISVPGAGRSPQAGAAHSTSRPQAERQVYDQFQLSIQPSGEETRMKELVGRISQEIRIRPTCREIESLQAQIREGRYQPDPQEIAARMLLQKEAD